MLVGGAGGGWVAGKGGCTEDTVDKTAPVSLGHAFTGMPRHGSEEGDHSSSKQQAAVYRLAWASLVCRRRKRKMRPTTSVAVPLLLGLFATPSVTAAKRRWRVASRTATLASA